MTPDSVHGAALNHLVDRAALTSRGALRRNYAWMPVCSRSSRTWSASATSNPDDVAVLLIPELPPNLFDVYVEHRDENPIDSPTT